jgi:hypothetical protein
VLRRITLSGDKTDFRPRMSATDKNDAYVEVWEWYDIERNTMSVFCDGSEKFLVSPTKMPFAFGHPYVMIRNYDVPDLFYPMGELEAIEPLQHELNLTRTQMMSHRKRYSRKWLYKETAFDTDGRSALESDEDNVMVPVISEDNMNNVIVPMPAVINPPEFYNQSQLISDDIRSVSGLNEYQGGGMPEIRRTATEAAIIQDAANARVSDKLAIVEKSIGHCGRRMIMLAQQYMTGEQAVRIVGSEAQPVWLGVLTETSFRVSSTLLLRAVQPSLLTSRFAVRWLCRLWTLWLRLLVPVFSICLSWLHTFCSMVLVFVGQHRL